MSGRQISLTAMVEEIDREIITRKRTLGARASEEGTAAWAMVENMKAIADYLRRQIEEGKTGEQQAVKWRQMDPGRFLPARFEGPLLLSVLSAIPNGGGYRREVRYMDRREDPRQIKNVYAIADIPMPAPVGSREYGDPLEENTDVKTS